MKKLEQLDRKKLIELLFVLTDDTDEDVKLYSQDEKSQFDISDRNDFLLKEAIEMLGKKGKLSETIEQELAKETDVLAQEEDEPDEQELDLIEKDEELKERISNLLSDWSLEDFHIVDLARIMARDDRIKKIVSSRDYREMLKRLRIIYQEEYYGAFREGMITDMEMFEHEMEEGTGVSWSARFEERDSSRDIHSTHHALGEQNLKLEWLEEGDKMPALRKSLASPDFIEEYRDMMIAAIGPKVKPIDHDITQQR